MATRRRAVLAAVSLLATCGLAASAGADVFLALPGSNCVKWSGSDPSYWYSTIENPSSSTTLKVDCPLPNYLTDLPASGFVGVVWARDQHSTQDVSCQMLHAKAYSTSLYVWASSASTTEDEESSYQFLGFTDDINNDDWSDHHWLYTSCQIPPAEGGKSGVGNYYVEHVSR